MGYFEMYCSFCAGPLGNPHQAWMRFLEEDAGGVWPPKDGGWSNPPGYPVPTKPKEDIVRITAEDGAYWDDWVSVSPMWEPSWVSPSCSHDDRGEVFINDSSDWQFEEDTDDFLVIHRGCLSFACRRLNITPQDLWESLFEPESAYWAILPLLADTANKLLHCVDYYDMEERNDQFFQYAIKRYPEDGDAWFDPDTMEDTVWLLTTPRCLPMPAAVPDTTQLTVFPPDNVPCMKLFSIPELLDLVLIALIDPEAASNADENTSARTVLALCSVSHFFHSILALSSTHQHVFLRIAASYGWMLPCTPADWASWEITPETDSPLDHSLDWRAFLVTSLRGVKTEPALRNRERMNRMAVQFARGRVVPATEDVEERKWSVGTLESSSLVPPEPWGWEIGDEENDLEGAEGGEDDVAEDGEEEHEEDGEEQEGDEQEGDEDEDQEENEE
ncbi:hypothetical protein C8F01DRAFT_1156042 [Mycena amicta]|nr:hypothetical protein C8F01DRAFT_1156042 [Mycena amicta]